MSVALFGLTAAREGAAHVRQPGSRLRIERHVQIMANDDFGGRVLSSALTPAKGLHTFSITRILRGSYTHSCTLHLYFDLPAQLFADPYELSHRRGSYTFERFGGGNLEAPVFAPGAGGPSGLLLDVIIPGGGVGESRDDKDILSIEVPLHARYGVPKRDGELIDEVVLPPPEAFWACAQERADGEGAGEGTTHIFIQ